MPADGVQACLTLRLAREAAALRLARESTDGLLAACRAAATIRHQIAVALTEAPSSTPRPRRSTRSR